MLRSSFLLLTAICAFGFAQAQTLKPYLQSMTDHSVWIGWRTTSNTETVVTWGTTPDALVHSDTGTVHSFNASNIWHKVKLTGLAPNTPYYYQVRTGNQVSEVARFRTYPTPNGANGHIRVLIVGDTQHPGNATTTFNAAKNNLTAHFGPNLEDHVHLILKQGDNVDQGTLALYSSMHFDPLNVLSANIPTMTVVGNHEYYQNSDLSLYFPHFEFDDNDLLYNGMAGQDGEHYYAFRVGKLLFCMLNSNEWWSRQTDWLEDVIGAADTDPTVHWIFGTAHHPLRCENWVSDGSAYIRDQIVPTLRVSPKTAMYTSGHSHMYARGSNRDSSVWEVISGGGGLIQNWNQNEEANYPDVQRSFDVSTYQIMDIDLDAGTMDVTCYTTGNFQYTMPNVQIDQFHRILNRPGPAKPQFAPLPDTTIALPYTFVGTPYVSPVGEPYNSTEFEVAGADGDFSGNLILNVKRDFEDFFQIESAAYFSPIDQMAGVDIFQLHLDSTQVYSGKNWIRVRYRDQNLEWSPWSDPMPFYAQNGKTPLAQEPIAWWHFNGDAVDATGHGFDGTVPANGVTFPVDEPVRGQVAAFNNTQSIPVHTGTTASAGLPTVQMTVSGWVKVNTADTWGGFIGCVQDNGSYERGWVLGTRDKKFSFALASANTGTMTYLTDTEDFILNQWYYVTATYNGSTMKLFVNGVLKNSTNAQNGDISYAGLASDWFGIGSYVDENENWLHDGALDELIIWERALSDAEVTHWYQQQSNVPPSVSLVTPMPNDMFYTPAAIPMTATATDIDGTVSVVEFFSGAQKLYEDVDGLPYTFTWSNAPAGIHTITVRATDNLGAKTTAFPIEVIVLYNTPPTVAVTQPGNGSTFTEPASLTATAEANDLEGPVSLVEFFANGDKIGEDNDGAPFNFAWNGIAAGQYAITARATDMYGEQNTSTPVQIEVKTAVGTETPAGFKTIGIAPNPSSGKFRFQTDLNLSGARLTLYTTDGQVALQRTLALNEVDIKALPDGIYMVELRVGADQQYRTKLVKQ